MAPPLADITEQQFDRLKALRPTGKKKNGRALWECECKCGNTAEVTISALRKGVTRSCGCLRREVGRTNLAAARLARYADPRS